MSSNSDASNVSRRRFLAVAGTVAAASSFAVGRDANSAPAPLPPPPPPLVPDHLVTIDITTVATTNKISYWVGTPAQDASNLPVKEGESIMWQAKTVGVSHRLAVLFRKKTPFADKNGPVYAFEGSEADEANGIGGNIGQVGSHSYKYCVAVFDDATKKTYTDDPKIIVGTGHLDAEAEIDLAQDDLKEAYAELSSKPKLQKKILSIERKLERIVDELK
jgi:hypothetical protein